MVVLILVVVQALLFPFMWAWSPWGVIAVVAFELLWLAFMVADATIDIRRRGTFRCILDDAQIQCVCPVRHKGESFTLRLDEIECIEKEVDDGSRRWYLHGCDGKRYWLTSNYGNPDDEFIREILALAPRIPQTET